jgi:DHA1 family bicyclomycin/chloramphenicol resistance-like MFS transporter
VFVIGSAGCALSTDAWQVIGWRVVQALGASAGVALARAMVRDLYDRNDAARVFSTLMTVMAVAPLLGPIAGAQILEHASWQAIFWTLVGIGLLTAAAILTLPETLPHDQRVSSSPGLVLAGYRSLLGNRQFVAYASAIGFYFAGLFASIACTPFAYIRYHRLSPQLYSLLFAAMIVGLMIANVANSRWVTRFGSRRMLLVGTVGVALSGVLVAVVAGTGWGGIHSLVPAVFMFVSARRSARAQRRRHTRTSLRSWRRYAPLERQRTLPQWQRRKRPPRRRARWLAVYVA